MKGMLPSNLWGRILTYAEIVIVSLAWFAFVGAVVLAGVTYLGRGLLQEWAPKGLDWPVVATIMVVFLLPYLVIAAAVWGVNLSIMGAQAKKVTAGDRVEPSRIVE